LPWCHRVAGVTAARGSFRRSLTIGGPLITHTHTHTLTEAALNGAPATAQTASLLAGIQ